VVVTERPTVLCIVDRPDWAHCRKTDALARALADSHRIVKRYHADVTGEDIERADCVLLYYWLQLDRLGALREVALRRRDRLVVGICSHFELQGGGGAWREPGLAMLQTVPRAVFANSRLLVDEFGPQLGRPIHFTPNGVDTGFFQPPSSESRRHGTAPLRVGWTGSLTNHGAAHRGVQEFIAPAVAAAGDAELHLAVREEKWRSREEMLHFFQSIDVYVCASESEGTPNPCLEAAACGVPVVTTRVGNMPELIRNGENGFLVDRDVAAIADCIRRLRDGDLRSRLGRAARATVVEAWDWRHQAVNYATLFRAVVGDDRTASA
jgi:glycosyltransferase involved in cell wall biosynthesis